VCASESLQTGVGRRRLPQRHEQRGVLRDAWHAVHADKLLPLGIAVQLNVCSRVSLVLPRSFFVPRVYASEPDCAGRQPNRIGVGCFNITCNSDGTTFDITVKSGTKATCTSTGTIAYCTTSSTGTVVTSPPAAFVTRHRR
jgi:hypothetical protein